jgi:hypothetical protein
MFKLNVQTVGVASCCEKAKTSELKTMHEGNIERAYPRGKRSSNTFEWGKCVFWLLVQAQQAPRAQKKDGISPLLRVSSRVEVYNFIFQSGIRQLVVQQRTKSVGLPQVQRSEVQEKVPVHQFVINAEEMLLGLATGVPDKAT